MTGCAWRGWSVRSAAAGVTGRPTWSGSGCGTSRIWSGSTTTPSCAGTTSSSSSRSPPVTSSRERFLTELTLDPPDASSDLAGPPLLDDDYLILSTIHSAKGQEWSALYVLNVIDGCIPSDLAAGSSEEIEEERRLVYVAMTRAKDTLELIVPQRCYVTGQARHGDRHLNVQRTRFIPESILEHFQAKVWPPLGAKGDRPARPPTPQPVDIGARMRRRWG